MLFQDIKLHRICYRLKKNDTHRFFARFQSVRWLHRYYNKLKCILKKEPYGLNKTSENSALFNNYTHILLQELRDTGIATGLQIPESIIDEIYQHALHWLPERVDNRNCQNQEPYHFDIPTPLSINSVKILTEDPKIVQVVGEYLGYSPRLQSVRLWWLVPGVTQSDIVSPEPLHLHWDIWSYNAVTAFFYLTDVKHESGPHMLVKNSHLKKPTKMRFRSCQQSYSTILQHFCPSQVAIIEGPAGTGFLEDPFCIHGTMPVLDNRLMLQIRYI